MEPDESAGVFAAEHPSTGFAHVAAGEPDAVGPARDPVGSVPLTLITGPANAAKAGAVLARLRALLAQEPLLVVPTSADVDHYRRELVADGIVFGAEVLTFSRLMRVLATAVGVPGRPLGPVAVSYTHLTLPTTPYV